MQKQANVPASYRNQACLGHKARHLHRRLRIHRSKLSGCSRCQPATASASLGRRPAPRPPEHVTTRMWTVWLDAPDRVTYKMCVIVYRCLRGQAPRYLADHFITSSDIASRLHLRSANRHQLIVPRCRLNTYGRRAFSIAGPTVWISLPEELRDPACGSDSIKQFLETILFSLY